MTDYKFEQVWVVDFEFNGSDGEPPSVVCMVAKEISSGDILRLSRDELDCLSCAPFPTGPDVLVVSFYALAEWGCFLELGWPLPENSIDLYVEFRAQTNGLELPTGHGLLGAMNYYGIGSMAFAEKDAMRQLILSGGPWSVPERCAILLYCEKDVQSTALLLERMIDSIDVPRALLRGKYLCALSRVERRGVPVDRPLLSQLEALEPRIRDFIIVELAERYSCFEGHAFRQALFAQWCEENGIPWPTLESGALSLSKETFKEQAAHFPEVRPLAEARELLKQASVSGLCVGQDGRNRAMLSPFGGSTGRNQPSTRKYVFGRPKWMRRIVRPEPGKALAYVDWSQQEFGIAAALSGDDAMLASYRADDPYIEFARRAGAVPREATKESHPTQRELFKSCALGVLFGMGEVGLAARLRQPVEVARQLLNAHRRTFFRFHEWMEGVLNHAYLHGSLHTAFGWPRHVTARDNERSIRNYLMQANGAEMLRVALCELDDKGVEVVATVHDAFLIESERDSIEDAIRLTREAMDRASEIVLDGVLTLRSDVEMIGPGRHLLSESNSNIWDWIQVVLDEQGGAGHG